MATAYTIYDVQIMDRATGKAVISSGGKAAVLTDGTGDLATLYNPDSNFASLSNPVTPTRGKIRFATLDTVSTVDLVVQAPGGQWVYLEDVVPGEVTEIWIDSFQKNQTAMVPFSHADSTATTEEDTGFDLAAGTIVLPTPYVRVFEIDATEDIDVGLLSSESGGDADGFIDGASVATAGTVKPTRTNGSDTMGALLSVQDSANAGDIIPEPYVIAAAVSITYTTSAGSDSCSGLICLPILLA